MTSIVAVSKGYRHDTALMPGIWTERGLGWSGTVPDAQAGPEMAGDAQAVYEAIAEAMRDYGYRAVTAADVREIDEAPGEERQGVIEMFARQQLQEARESGRLLPAPGQPQGPFDPE